MPVLASDSISVLRRAPSTSDTQVDTQAKRGVVLVAVDDSAESERAFQWALTECCGPNDQLHLLHVIPRLFSLQTSSASHGGDVAMLRDSTGHMDQRLEKAEAFIVQRFISKLNEQQEQQFRPIVHIVKSDTDTESIGQAICKKAEELKAAYVVMSKHNRGRLAEFFLGSVSKYCAQNSTRPVAVVH